MIGPFNHRMKLFTNQHLMPFLLSEHEQFRLNRMFLVPDPLVNKFIPFAAWRAPENKQLPKTHNSSSWQVIIYFHSTILLFAMKVVSYLRNKLSKSNISPLIGLIVCFFGTGSWVAVNGLWVELPILVQHAPEGWNLPSYITVVIQLGNIGPLLYTIGSKYAPHIIKESIVTHVIIVIAALACTLLGFLWKETSIVGGAPHSTALLTLVFFLALMACTSSVTFLPFMGQFKSGYIVTFFVGQGLSGLLPSIVALLQGVGSSSIKCPIFRDKVLKNSTLIGLLNGTYNSTSNATSDKKTEKLSLKPDEPLFSADGFFFFLVVIMIICEVCFILLNYLPKAKMEHVKPKESLPNKKISKDEHKPLEGRIRYHSETDHDPHELLELELTSAVDKDSQSSLVSESVYTQTVEDTNDSPTLSMKLLLLVLVLQAYLNAVFNGVIPSILSYACLPYGEKTYHLALTLSAIANPVASLLFYVVAINSVNYMVLWTAVYSVLCAYVIGIAAGSPCPILHDNAGGSFLIVSISMNQ